MTSQIEVIRATLKYSTQEELIQGMAPLISRRGLFIHTRMTKPVGSEVQFEFRLADGSKVYSGEGVVRKEVPFIGGPSSQKAGMLVALRRINRAFKEVVDEILGGTDASLKIAPDPEETVKNQKIVQTHGGEGLDIFGDDDLDLGLDSLFSGIEKTPSQTHKQSGIFSRPNDNFFGSSNALDTFSFADPDAKDEQTPLPSTFGTSEIAQSIEADAPRATILTRSDQFAAVKGESQIRTGQFAAIKEIVKAEREAAKSQRTTVSEPEDDLFPAPEMLDDLALDELALDEIDTSAFAESLSEAFSTDEVNDRLQTAEMAAETQNKAADAFDITKPPQAALEMAGSTEKISHTRLNTPIGKIEADESTLKEKLSRITGDNPVLEEASLKAMTRQESAELFRPRWGQRNKIDYESTLRKTSPYMTAISRNDSQGDAIRALQERAAERLNQDSTTDTNADSEPSKDVPQNIPENVAADANAEAEIKAGTADLKAEAEIKADTADLKADTENKEDIADVKDDAENKEDTADLKVDAENKDNAAEAKAEAADHVLKGIGSLSALPTTRPETKRTVLPNPSSTLSKVPSSLPKLGALPKPGTLTKIPSLLSKTSPAPSSELSSQTELSNKADQKTDAEIIAPENSEPTTAEFPGNKDDTVIKDNQKEPDMNKRPSNSSFKIADEETPSQLFAALQEDMFSSIDAPAVDPAEAEAETAAPAEAQAPESSIESMPEAPAIPQADAAELATLHLDPEPEPAPAEDYGFDTPCLDMATIEASEKPAEEEPANDPFANSTGVATLESMNGTSTPAVQRDTAQAIVMTEVTSTRQAVPRRRERNPEPEPPAPEPKKKGFFSKLFGR
ncbi:MAG: hypothetical protein II767_11160 [Proteobacteria bacterium]|nr:hypothetical protein [Pseudomonadota bacterium]